MRLLLLCLAAVAVALEDSPETKNVKGQDVEGLASAVVKAAKSDFSGIPSTETVVSKIVPNAPPAELANGDGDLSVVGACEADVEALCLKVPPGEGRIAACLTKRMKNEHNGNVIGRKVSKGCRKEVSAFYKDRSKSINKNLQLATACKGDVEKFCGDAKKEDGAITACLRSHHKKLAPICQVHIFKSMLSGAFDLRTDVKLWKACSSDAGRLCSDVPKGNGNIQSCLVRDLRPVGIMFLSCSIVHSFSVCSLTGVLRTSSNENSRWLCTSDVTKAVDYSDNSFCCMMWPSR